MAYFDTTWYCNFGDGSSTGFFAIARWAASTVFHCGTVMHPLAAQGAGNDRIFVSVACTGGTGTTGTTEQTYTLTRGAKTVDNQITWQEITGCAAMNGDVTNTPSWNVVKGQAVSIGQVIKNVAGTLYLICTTAGTAGSGSEPSWAAFTNAGATTADNTVTWTTLGAPANYTPYGACFARLATVMNAGWFQAGNTCYIADNHNEQSTITITIPGVVGATAANPNKIICADHTVAPPTSANLKNTAVVGTNSTGGITLMSNSTYNYTYGVTFQCSGGTTANLMLVNSGAANIYSKFEQCAFQFLSGTIATAAMIFGPASSGFNSLDLVDCSFTFQAANQSAYFRDSDVTWRNPGGGAGLTGTVPASPFTLLTSSSTGCFNMLVEGVDFSALASGKTLINMTNDGYAMFKDCKLNAAATVASISTKAGQVDMVRCDSGGNSYRNERYGYHGTETTSTTVYRTGGMSDGVTSMSRQIVTTATVGWLMPFWATPVAKYNTTTAANLTVTMHGIVNAAALPNNDEFWFDVEYLGASTSPLGSVASGTKSNLLATGSALTADSTSAWDAGVTARGNTTAYSVGAIIKTASNPGRIFFCTASTGSSAASEPGGYATATDGTSVTDGNCTFRAGVRFSQAITLSAPQPAQAGYIWVTPKAAKASTTYYYDPLIT